MLFEQAKRREKHRSMDAWKARVLSDLNKIHASVPPERHARRTIVMYSDAGREQPQDVDVCVSTSCVQESKFCFSQACPEFSTS